MDAYNVILKSKDLNNMREQRNSSINQNGAADSSPNGNKENSNSENSAKAVRRSIKDYIFDKPFRIRSYLRRRPIPLKRCLELDIQCATKSFHLQINSDIDEAVYCGAPELVQLFLQPSGLKLSDVCKLLSVRQGHRRERLVEENESDDDFFDSIKTKRGARAESAKKMTEVEFIKSPADRAKKFKSGKEGIFAKINEIESVCGVVSFTVIANPEKELCSYSGDAGLITDFFTRGVSRSQMSVGWNVRQFDCEEVEYNVCSVPACVVSRNTLGKWRQAALDLFNFPSSLPLSLHVCPQNQRDRWMAELDLEPHNKAKVVVCSLHFRDGYPTKENPFPTELLGEPRGKEAPQYRGRRPEELQVAPRSEQEVARSHAMSVCGDMINLVMTAVNCKIEKIEREKEEELAKRKENEERRRRDILAHKNVKYYQFHSFKRRKKLLLPKKNKFKPPNRKQIKPSAFVKWGLKCRYCNAKFGFTRALYHHVTRVHWKMTRKVEPTLEERSQALSILYPNDQNTKQLDPKKKYVCAVCKSVCDLLGLFLHMKQIHQGLLCQYCLKLFKKVRDLEHHLAVSHKVSSRYYTSFSRMDEFSGSRATLACGECSVLLSVEQAEYHSCSTRRYYECPQCRHTENSQTDLEHHLIRCTRLQSLPNMPRRQTVLHHILTGTYSLQEGDDLLSLSTPLTPIESAAKDTVLNSKSLGNNTLPKKPVFSCSDRNVLVKYGSGEVVRASERPVLEHLPNSGTIFWGPKSCGISNHVKKEFKDLGIFIDLATEMKNSGSSADEIIDKEILNMKIEKAGRNFIVSLPKAVDDVEDIEEIPAENDVEVEEPIKSQPSPDKKQMDNARHKLETKQERVARLEAEIEVSLTELREVIGRETSCLFCQQCKTVWVEATFLLSHLVVVHDGGEETTQAIQRIKRLQRDTKGREVMFRYVDTEAAFSFDFYRCSYCATTDCKTYADLFAHTTEAHSTKVLTCNICQNIFLNYGSLISHVCCGPPTSSTARARFACKVCLKVDLSSFLDFQTHIRSEHHICEICFQPLGDQRKLYEHCATHEQDSFCLQCFVTFEKADSFKKHLALKHGSEVKDCGQCYAPTWPHVYHFCLVDQPIVCQTCHKTLANSSAYRVHQRKHTGIQPHGCTSCGKKFISKSLLWKHQVRRHPDLNDEAARSLAAKKLKRDCEKIGAKSVDSVVLVQDLLRDWMNDVMEALPVDEADVPEEVATEASPEKPQASALDAAIASIMPDSDAVQEKPRVQEIFPQPDRAAIQASIAERNYTPDNSWQAGLDALLAGAGAPVVANSSANSSDSAMSSPEKSTLPSTAVMSGLWNQDLMFIPGPDSSKQSTPNPVKTGLKTLEPVLSSPGSVSGNNKSLENAGTVSPAPMTRTQWDLDLSESSGDEIGPKARRTPALKQRTVSAPRPLLDHDYCYTAYLASQQPIVPPAPVVSEMSEMDKILSNVAFGGFNETTTVTKSKGKASSGGRSGDKKKKKKKKKKKRKKEQIMSNSRREQKSDSSSGSESDIDVCDNNSTVDMFGIQARQKLIPGGLTPTILDNHQSQRGRGRPKKGHLAFSPALGKRGPKPKYHTPDAAAKAGGVVAGTARPSFDTDSSEHEFSDSDNDLRRKKDQAKSLVDIPSNSDTLGSSDLDTDFSAEEEAPVAIVPSKQPRSPRKSAKASLKQQSSKPALKLKIKLPPQPPEKKKSSSQRGLVPGELSSSKRHKLNKRRRSSGGGTDGTSHDERDMRPISKKMRESLALNNSSTRLPTSGSDDDQEERLERPAMPVVNAKLYCYCQCPHDEVSEMIGCDAPDCLLEWFHFECVGILIPPEGKWYCPQCSKRYGL